MSTKDWIEKDFYKVLGVSKDATPEEIKKSYRKLARDNHPDQQPGNVEAEQRFKEISEANDVLSDADKRKEYDEARRLFGGGGFRSRAPDSRAARRPTTCSRQGGGGGLGDLFGGLFGANNANRASRSTTTRGPRRGSDVEGEVTVDFGQAIEGVTVGMQMVSDAACAACRGTGAKSGTVPRVCPTCEGSGMQTSTSGGVFAVTEPCRDCRGRGHDRRQPVPVCHGSGRGRSTRTMQVRIPAGVTDGQRIRLKGKGGAGENGGAAGDLYVIVHVRPHPRLRPKGDNLTLTAPVTFTEAALAPRSRCRRWAARRSSCAFPPGRRTDARSGCGARASTKRDGTKGDLLVTVEVRRAGRADRAGAQRALVAYRRRVRVQPTRGRRLFAADAATEQQTDRRRPSTPTVDRRRARLRHLAWRPSSPGMHPQTLRTVRPDGPGLPAPDRQARPALLRPRRRAAAAVQRLARTRGSTSRASAGSCARTRWRPARPGERADPAPRCGPSPRRQPAVHRRPLRRGTSRRRGRLVGAAGDHQPLGAPAVPSASCRRHVDFPPSVEKSPSRPRRVGGNFHHWWNRADSGLSQVRSRLAGDLSVDSLCTRCSVRLARKTTWIQQAHHQESRRGLGRGAQRADEGNPNAEPVPSAALLLMIPGNTAAPLLSAVGVDPGAVDAAAQRAIGRLPSARGASVSQPALSGSFARVLADAETRRSSSATPTSPPSTC